ncbi:2,3-bisphosphoglycerate-independent phosphoglycerate mutase [Francisellaceae bacterium]|nr:2,3-bisphosphoglycerate-independent phosphoglycerate mutase [Francisellaceae bacterium]
MQKKPLVLLILDGWGYREEDKDNAINNAQKPFFDKLWSTYPHTLIDASGRDVGLPNGQMGNSEVGHVNIGSGRIVYQELSRIDKEIEDGAFAENPELTKAIDAAISQNKAVHLMGLLSPGGVHSHLNHIRAMIHVAARRGAKEVYVHAFLDGRDTPPRSALPWIKEINDLLHELNIGRIASICGRYFAMDRDQKWERVKAAYNLLTEGEAKFHVTSAKEGLNEAYERGENDEFVSATAITDINDNPATVNDGDALIYMNFRADRARAMAYPFANNDFTGFERKLRPNCHFVTLTQYAEGINAPKAYNPVKLTNVLGQYLADNNMTQLRIAETEKYAHVTFFFNGGIESVFEGEDRILIQSPDVATYDLQPEMSAYELTDKLTGAIESGKYDVIICNYANSDMVGHTGNYDAAIKAIEALDACLEKVIASTQKVGGEALITADHGNSDMMVDPITGKAHTAHTTNPVPLIYVGRKADILHDDGRLSDIAPTMLSLMGKTAPEEMTGRVLFEPNSKK